MIPSIHRSSLPLAYSGLSHLRQLHGFSSMSRDKAFLQSSQGQTLGFSLRIRIFDFLEGMLRKTDMYKRTVTWGYASTYSIILPLQNLLLVPRSTERSMYRLLTNAAAARPTAAPKLTKLQRQISIIRGTPGRRKEKQPPSIKILG